MVDIKATLIGGSFHEVDSSDMAFKIAGSMALREGVQKAGPVLLEPVMKLEVVVPEQNTGDVIGDLVSRRGQIDGMEMHSVGHAGRPRHWCRWPRCSVTPRRCARSRRAAAPSRWSSLITSRCRRTAPGRFSAWGRMMRTEAAVSEATGRNLHKRYVIRIMRELPPIGSAW